MRLNSPQINLIVKACTKASRSLIRDFGEIENLQVSAKGPGDFVTSADKRTEKILIDELGIKIIESMVEAGSGSLPEKNIRSIALKFKPSKYSVNHVSDHFRRSPKPIIGYIKKESYFIDLKAVLPHQKDNIVGAIKSI